MLNGNLLLPFAPMLVECLELTGVERHQFVRVLQCHVSPFNSLIGMRRPAQTFHDREMSAHHLLGQHSFSAVPRFQTVIVLDHPRNPHIGLTLLHVLVTPQQVCKFTYAIIEDADLVDF